MALRKKNPISFDEAKALIESKRWPHPKNVESTRSRSDRESYNEGIDEALDALSGCKKLRFKRARRTKKENSIK
jgi:hypothetical protein